MSKEVQGIYRDPDAVISMLRKTEYLLNGILVAPSENQVLQLLHTEKTIEEMRNAFRQFTDSKLATLRSHIAEKNVELINTAEE